MSMVSDSKLDNTRCQPAREKHQKQGQKGKEGKDTHLRFQHSVFGGFSQSQARRLGCYWTSAQEENDDDDGDNNASPQASAGLLG